MRKNLLFLLSLLSTGFAQAQVTEGTGELLINQIPLICSYGFVNDLAAPFRHLRDGKGIGSLFVIRAVDEPSTTDPGEGNLTEFKVLFGDTYVG